MRFVDVVRRHLLLSAAACGVIAGSAIGLFLPIRPAAPPRADELQWTLPPQETIRRFDEAAYQSLRTAGFWDSRIGGGRGTRSVSTWTLRAIMTGPVAQASVMLPGATSQKWVRVGDTLPDGAVLVGVDRDTIWFEQEGCRRARKLYPAAQGTAPPNATDDQGCIGGGGSDAPRASAPSTPKARRTTSGATQSNGK